MHTLTDRWADTLEICGVMRLAGYESTIARFTLCMLPESDRELPQYFSPLWKPRQLQRNRRYLATLFQCSLPQYAGTPSDPVGASRMLERLVRSFPERCMELSSKDVAGVGSHLSELISFSHEQVVSQIESDVLQPFTFSLTLAYLQWPMWVLATAGNNQCVVLQKDTVTHCPASSRRKSNCLGLPGTHPRVALSRQRLRAKDRVLCASALPDSLLSELRSSKADLAETCLQLSTFSDPDGALDSFAAFFLGF